MQGKTVLLVEDEAAIVAVVRRYLERDGYRVMVASDGQRAVDEFQRLRPDLVLLDLMLPGLDGWEVCRRIRQQGGTPGILPTARAALPHRPPPPAAAHRVQVALPPAPPPRACLYPPAVTGPGAGLRLRRVRTHHRLAHQEPAAEVGARSEESPLHPT